MASRFWVGGGGSWNATNTTNWSTTSGGAGGASVPTTSDDVFLDENSGTGTISVDSGGAIALANNFVCTGYAGTLSLTFSITTAGTVVTLSSSMTLTGSAGFALNPQVAGSTVTLTSAGKTVPGNVGFGPTTTGSAVLADALVCLGTLTVNSGTFNTNGFAVTCGTFNSSNSSTRTLTLGASSITVTGAGAAWNVATSTNLTVTANTATVTMSGGNPTFRGAVNWNGLSLNMTGAGIAALDTFNPYTLANLTRTAGLKTDSFSLSGSLIITGTLTFNSSGGVTNRTLVQSVTAGTQKSVTAAAVSLSNVDFMDIAAAGTATWSGTSIGDAGGNSGITFTTSTTRYAVVAGNWSSTSTWSTTSGGAGGASVPLPQDDVVMDGNSAAGTYTADMPRMGRALTCTGFTRTLALSTANTNTVLGSVTLASGMTLTQSQTFIYGGRGSHTLTSAGKTWPVGVRFEGPGGSYALQDAFAVSGSIPINSGLVTNGFAVSSSGSISSTTATYTRTIDFGGSIVTITGTNSFPINFTSLTGLTFLTSSATIVLATASTSSRTIVAASTQNFGVITYTVASSPGALILSNPYAIGTLSVGSGRTLTLPSLATTTVTNWNVAGGIGGNLLAANTSDIETDASGWVNVQNDTLARTTTVASTGSASLAVTSVIAGLMRVYHAPSRVPVVAGATYTVSADVRAAATPQQAQITLEWYDAGGGGLGATYGSAVTDSTTSWSRITYTGVAPATAVTALVHVRWNSTAAGGETHYLDNVVVVPAVVINSSTPGSAATLSKSSGYIASDYASVQDITGTGGATFYMGSRSTNVSGNTGLTFTDAPQRFWVGGTATWDATVGTKWAVVSGGTGGLAVPTTSDDVYFDANSGAGTVTGPTGNLMFAKNFSGVGFTGTWSMTAGLAIIGTSAILGTTATIASLAPILSGFIGTFASSGKTISSLTIQGATASVTQADALNVSGSLTFTSGTWNTGGFSVTLGSFSSTNTNTRTLTLGSSSVTMTGATSTWNCSTSTGLTITANTSTLTISGSNSSFNGGSLNWNGLSLVFTNSGSVMASGSLVTLANLTKTGTAIKTDAITLAGPVTVTGTFTVTGNSSVNRVLVSSLAVGTSRTITAAAVSLSNVDFMDITGAGAATWGDVTGTTAPSWTAGGSGGNLLTANDASMETSIGNWSANGAGTTLAQSSAQALVGASSLAVTATTTSGGNIVIASAGVSAVVAGSTYNWMMSTRAAATVRSRYLIIYWYSGADGTGFLSQSNGSASADTTTSWTQRTVTAVAPPGAQSCRVALATNEAVAVSEVFYADAAGLYMIVPGGVGNALGNTGITFTPSATQTWQGTTSGSWSNAAKWTSRVPLPQDDVVVSSAFSAGQTITVDMPRMGRDISFLGTTGNPILTLQTFTSFFGSWVFSASMVKANDGTDLYARGRGSHTIRSNGVAIGAYGFSSLFMHAPGGTYTLLDALAGASGLMLGYGTFDAATFNVTAGQFRTGSAAGGTSTATRGLLLNGSTVALTGSGTIWDTSTGVTNMTTTMNTATIVLSSTSSSSRTFQGAGFSYGTLTYTVASSPGALVVTGGNTFGTLNVGAGRTLTLPSSTTTTVTNWNVAGTVVARDTFTRADSTTTLGTAESGQAWQALSGVWGITSNKAYLAAATGSVNGQCYAVLDVGSADVDLTYTAAAVGNQGGAVIRASDASNAFIVGNGIYRQTGGSTVTTLTTFTAPVAGDVMRVVARGSTITVYKNGVQVGTATDTQNLTVTKHGLRAVSSGDFTTTWDDLSIVGLTTVNSSTPGTQAVLLSLGTQLTSSYLVLTDVAAGVVPAWTTGGSGGNLLTANQSSVETDTTGWISNGTIARTTSQALAGAASLQLTSTGSNQTVETWPGLVPVTVGQLYVAFSYSRALTTPRNVRNTLAWSSAYPGIVFLASTVGATTLNSTTGWTQHIVGSVAPATALGAYIATGASDSVSGDVMYVDKAMIAATLPAYARPTSVDGGNNVGWSFLNPVFSASLSDSVGAVDVLTRVSGFPRSLSDTTSASDVLTRTTGSPRAITETQSLSEVVARTGQMTRALSETQSVVDVVTRVGAMARAPAEATSVADALTRIAVSPRALTETLSSSDSLAFAFAYSIRLKKYNDATGLWEPHWVTWWDATADEWRVHDIKRFVPTTGTWVSAQVPNDVFLDTFTTFF